MASGDLVEHRAGVVEEHTRGRRVVSDDGMEEGGAAVWVDAVAP